MRYCVAGKNWRIYTLISSIALTTAGVEEGGNGSKTFY